MSMLKRAWLLGLVFALCDPTYPIPHRDPLLKPRLAGGHDAGPEGCALEAEGSTPRSPHAIREWGAQQRESSKSRASAQRSASPQGRPRVGARRRIRRQAHRRAAVARRLARLEASVKRASQAAIRRDDLRGEDPEVRQAVLAALGHHAGTVVVMDPNSGRVYSIVNQEWALRRGFKPCSTIKLLVGLAGLNEGLIEAKVPIPLGGGSIAMNLIEALAYSNNPYFEIIGERLGRALLLRYAREWGLGQPTGINLPHESAGRLPSEQLSTRASARYSRALRGRRAAPVSTVGRMASHGDGFAITALQLAAFTAAIANGGTLYRPQIVRSEAEARRLTPSVLRRLDLPPEHRESLIAGMIAAVEYGTAKLAYIPDVPFAGKTGSCRSDSLWLGLFTSFAPISQPRLVVTVIIYGRYERGATAASIAAQIYQQLAHRLGGGL
jgi:penicillin-binding protein 2